jgi:hypothetical protein
MTARDHNNLLGIFILIKGGMLAFTGVILALVYLGTGAAIMGSSHRQDEQFVGGVMMAVGVAVGLILIVVAAFDIFTGVKIRRMAPVGRVLGIIVSVISLFSFPLGTALGVYGLWFLLGDMGKSLYLGGSEGPAGNYGPPNQPPPNSWA